MKKIFWLIFVALTLLVLNFNCHKKEADVKDQAANIAQEADDGDQSSHPFCIGPLTEEPVLAVNINNQQWEQKGSTLTLKTPLKDNFLRIGVLSDIKENSEENKCSC